MGKNERKTTSEDIKQAIKDLDVLRMTCIEYSKKTRETNSKESGQVHKELEDACVTMENTWLALIVLLEKTMEFLGCAVETYDSSDQQTSIALRTGALGHGSGGGFRGSESNSNASGGAFGGGTSGNHGSGGGFRGGDSNSNTSSAGFR